MKRSDRFLLNWWGLATVIALVFLCFSSANAYETILEQDNITDWQYSYNYNSNWLNEGAILNWPKKDTTFLGGNHIYVRKEINLTDTTQGIIKVRAENNYKCYVNGNLVDEKHKQVYPFNCQRNYHYGIYSFAGFTYIDVSKYLKNGTNTIACEAWIDHDAYYYERFHAYIYGLRLKYYVSGNLYLDVNFFQMKDFVLWSSQSTDFYKIDKKISSSYYDFRLGDCPEQYETWSGPWQWAKQPFTDSDYFRWTHNTIFCPHCIYLDPIWPYQSDVYVRTWIWSDEAAKTIQISDTKQPTCYLNEELLDLKQNNDPYWTYSADVNLKQGQNLLACKSPKSEINSFDYKVTEQNGPLAIIDVYSDTNYFEIEQPITFTIVLANASHPETDVALTLESWGTEDYQQILSTANTSTLEIVLTPNESGEHDLLFTAADMIDGDTDSYQTQIEISVPEEFSDMVGFYPVAGNTDEKETNGDNSSLMMIVGAAAVGTVAVGLYASGTKQGFSLSKVQGSLNRMSAAINTLSSVYETKAQVNQQSFWTTMQQRYIDYKKAVAKIEAEKEALRRAEEARYRRKMASKAKRLQRELNSMVKAPLAKGQSLNDKYKQINAFMNKNKVSSSEARKLKEFIDSAEPLSPSLMNSTWNANKAAQEGKALKKQLGLGADDHLDDNINAFAKQYGLNKNEAIAFLKVDEGVQMFNNWKKPVQAELSLEGEESDIIPSEYEEEQMKWIILDLISFFKDSKLFMSEKSSIEIGTMYPQYAIYDEYGNVVDVDIPIENHFTIQELSLLTLTQVFGAYALRWLGNIKLPWTKTKVKVDAPKINTPKQQTTATDSIGRTVNLIEGNSGKGLNHIFKDHFNTKVPGKTNFKDFGFKTKDSVVNVIQKTISNGKIVNEGPNYAGLPTAVYEAEISGVNIRVVINPQTKELITAYPIS